jgi:hypothetical protein
MERSLVVWILGIDELMDGMGWEWSKQKNTDDDADEEGDDTLFLFLSLFTVYTLYYVCINQFPNSLTLLSKQKLLTYARTKKSQPPYSPPLKK